MEQKAPLWEEPGLSFLVEGTGSTKAPRQHELGDSTE